MAKSFFSTLLLILALALGAFGQSSPQLVGVLNVADYLSYTGFQLNGSQTSPCSQSSYSGSGTFQAVSKTQAEATVTASVDYLTAGLNDGSPMTAYSTGNLTIYALGPTGTRVTLTGTRTGQTTVTSSGATVSASASGGYTAMLPGGPASVSIDANLFPSGGTFTTGAETTCNGLVYSYVTAIDLSTYLVVNNNCPGMTCGTAQAVNAVQVIESCINPTDVTIFPGGPYSLSGQPTTENASFVPTDANGLPVGLQATASACGFSAGFNWQQQVLTLPGPSPFFPRTPSDVSAGSIGPDGSLHAPTTFFDPPNGGGYNDGEAPDPAYPFFWNSLELANGILPCTKSSLIQTADTLFFQDCPADPFLAGGQMIEFQTSLVGVVSNTSKQVLFTWKWQSSFNGLNRGGVAQLKSELPIDPQSGNGGVTITSINGVQLPTSVSTQISITASGLAYSRVSRTFNGTVTLKNVSANLISGPLQMVVFGISPNIGLVNATGNLSGTPYITVPNGLAPGQSVTVPVQFRNPSNATFALAPAIYSGAINE
ncbi:MAG: hypothetical protein JO097_21580 [Acidobacteriaceae bacterium]|nr:hypothetical protein [Acidobacteriaceae bacterium]MBV9767605.1 hypothetical protein [Acidobacteriaceae bacterium]